MELIAEEQAARLALIEPDGDHGAATTDGPDRLAQRPRVPRALERYRDRIGTDRGLEPHRDIVVRVDRLETHVARDRESGREPIHGEDPRCPGGASDLREDESDRATTEHDRRRSG